MFVHIKGESAPHLFTLSNALPNNSEDHPDARAVMYETTKYNERKIRDFLSALEGLKLAAKCVVRLMG